MNTLLKMDHSITLTHHSLICSLAHSLVQTTHPLSIKRSINVYLGAFTQWRSTGGHILNKSVRIFFITTICLYSTLSIKFVAASSK